MKCLRCCCCCCFAEEKTPAALDDSSFLIQDERGIVQDSQVQAFYVPRRHSSFQPSTYNPVSIQPGRSHSDSCSSSEEESAPEQRGRCWSTIPATSATDITSLIANRQNSTPSINNRSMVGGNDLPSGKFVFDRHILSEIAETEQEEESSSSPSKADADVWGHLTFTTSYDEQEQKLTVFLNEAKDLPKKGDEPYGTFVKLSITSSNKNFRLSRAVKNTFHPVYKEELVFHTNKSKWKNVQPDVYLRLSVFDCDRQGRHDAIGHVLLLLEKIVHEKKEHCLPLSPMFLPLKNLGQILVGLLYSPTQSRLSVHVIKARHLRLDPEIHKRHLRPLGRDVLDTFCKVTLMCGGQKVKTCRSRSSIGYDPFFDFRVNFIVPPQYLRDTSIIVAVVVRSTLGRDGATLGRVTTLGPYVELGDGITTHWGKMIQEGRSVVQWRNIYL